MQDQKNFSLVKIMPAVLTIAVGMMLVMMDTTIMNVALPHIQQAFSINLQMSQWAITAYTLSMATIIPYAGFLSDRYSSKSVFAISVFLFIIASLLISFSTNIQELILFRVLQGLAGGIVGPVGIAMSFKIIPIEKRGSLMGILGLPMLLAPIIGPTLSGWLISHFSWSTIFLINVPIGILALLMIFLFLPSFDKDKKTKIDKKGAMLAPFAFPFLIYSVHLGTDKSWTNPGTLFFLLTGLVMLLTFIMVEVKVEYPLLQIKAFKYSEFRKGLSLMWLNQIAVFGCMLLIPLYLQQQLGYSSFEAGMMMVPQALASFIGMIVGGKLFDKYGTKSAVLLGLMIMIISLSLLVRVTETTTVSYLLVAIITLGLGQGLVNMQVNNHALKSVPLSMINRVTPLSNEMLQVVNSFSIAFLTAFLSNQMNHTTISNFTNRAVTAYHNTFLMLALFVGIALLLTFFLKEDKVKRPLVKNNEKKVRVD
jgi:DHA2 family lincomycin resistance protein-like MFS transporter